MSDNTNTIEAPARRTSGRRKLAVILATALAVFGLSSVGATAAFATGAVVNPMGNYSVPSGGLFTFSGTGFSADDDVTVKLHSSGTVLGTFVVGDSSTSGSNAAPYYDGRVITDWSTPDARTGVVIPQGTSATSNQLDFYTTTGGTVTPEATVAITVTANPYTVSVTNTSSGGTKSVQVTNTNTWAPGVLVTVKLDFETGYQKQFNADGSGNFNESVTLPSGLSGQHTITVIAPASGTYPAASVSTVLTF